MAIQTNAQTSFTLIGAREDLSNTVYRIDPEDVPFQSNISTTGKATSIIHEWQTQALASPSANYAIEGDTNVTNNTITQRVRLQNKCSISKKVYSVSGTSRALDVAGVSDELLEQRLLKGIELKRDMEVTLLANNAYDSGGTNTARECAGLPAYISQTDATGALFVYSAAAGTGADAWTLNGSTTQALNLTILNGAMKTAYVSGGKPKMLMLSPDQKLKFSQMAFAAGTGTGAAPLRYNLNAVQQGALIGAVDTWMSDFGLVDVVVNVQQASDSTFLNKTAFLVDPRFVSVDFLRPMMTEPLAKTGDADQEHILAEYTLKVGAPKAHAMLVKLS